MLKKVYKPLLKNRSVFRRIIENRFGIPVFLFLLSLLSRLLLLNVFPPAMIYDELNYVMSAKSLYHTGENIPWIASSLFSWGNKNFDIVISELPSLILAPYFGLFRLDQFTARFPYVVISSLSVVFIYLISKHLLGSCVAAVSGIIMAFNPWSFHIGRTALEVNFAIMFFLIGIYFVIVREKWKIFYGLPFFLLGFGSYLGAKLQFIPVISALLLYKYISRDRKNNIVKPAVLFFVISISVLILYAVTLKYQPAGQRKGELLFFSKNWSSSQVNDERRQSIPNSLQVIFSNKASVSIKRILNVYLKAFSTISLFSRGETVSVYSIWEHGQFYYLDFFLIILGILYLFKRNKRTLILFFLIIGISPLVSSIDLVEETYAIRAFPMFPFLIVLSACGFIFVYELVNKRKLLFFIFVTIYIFMIFNFLYLYFYRYPIYSAERWFFSNRIIDNYIRLSESDAKITKIYVIPFEYDRAAFGQYLFYSGFYEKNYDIRRINENMKKREFGNGKVVFTSVCPENVKYDKGEVLIAERRKGCIEGEKNNHGIVDLVDAGTVFIIGNDYLCKGEDLPRYYRPFSISDFKLERMGKKEFCNKWIVDFNK